MGVANQTELERDAFYTYTASGDWSFRYSVRVADSDSTNYANPPRLTVHLKQIISGT
jgi:hypothetical protein